MTPEQFLERLKRNGPEPVYLFLGPEAYNRERCRRALIAAALPEEDRESGFIRHDLDQISIAAAMDDARSMSLFASRRLIWIARAEAALPRGEAASTGDEAVAEYLRQPSPETVVVIESSRFDFDGEDKARTERVQKFYSAVPGVVEFRPFAPEAARALAQNLAKAAGLQLGLGELATLLEATAGDASRIAVEIEKLKLFVGSRKVTAGDIAALVPDAQATTIFALVNSLARGDRAGALANLDLLARAGEYMPLALSFLATQFRMALVARDAGLRSAGEIQCYFNKIGGRIWPERARQIAETMHAFPKARLEWAVAKVFEADRGLRDARPDDRIVMEEMILEICGSTG